MWRWGGDRLMQEEVPACVPHPGREAGLQVAGLSRLAGVLCAHALSCWHWAPGEVFGPVCVSCEYLSRRVSVPGPGAPLGEHSTSFWSTVETVFPALRGCPRPYLRPDCSVPTRSPDPGPQFLDGREAFLGTKNVTCPVFQIGPWAGLEGSAAVD